MPFVPRTTQQIADGLNARIVARTQLTDLSAGSVLERMTWSVAEEVALVEQRLAALRAAFNVLDPSISDADLAERAQELPRQESLARGAATYASGSVLNVTRASAGAVQVLPKGSVVARTDTGLRYQTTVAVSFGVGVGTLTGVDVICLQPGTAGNCGPGTLTQLAGMPSWVVGATNTAAITSGQDEESKAAYQQRLALLFSSLAHSQRSALEFAAPSYVSSAGQRVKFAKTFVETPGFVDLVIDDGTGMQGLKRAGAVTTGTVPTTGIRTLWHEGPATAAIPSVKVTLAAGGVIWLLDEKDYTSIYERGVVLFKKGVVLQPGDIWEISGYQVYTGLISEIQRHLDGVPSQPYDKPGWVAGGCRCIVQPPTVQMVALDLHVVPYDGYDAYVVAQEAQSAAISFLSTLGPGETLFSGKLISELMGLGTMQGVHLFLPGTNQPIGDWYCAEKEVLRGSTGTIKMVPAL